MDYVIAVTSNDSLLGVEEKLLAHQKGTLHRAFSVCLFDETGRWLLQKRAACKYHSPGKWANSCCGHPRLHESLLQAAERRVFEELGVHVSLVSNGSFLYREEVGGGLIEHEFDHVFTGVVQKDDLHLNPEEVEEIGFFTADEIHSLLRTDPSRFASWFSHVYRTYLRTL